MAAAQLTPSETPSATEARIPLLDGLRGLAIGCVLVSHLSGSLGFRAELQAVAGPIGYFGVRIFFILTGFLVTHSLVREWDRNGGIDLVKFWKRRALRLLPVVVLFMAAVYAAALAKVRLYWPLDYIFPLTFTMNYYPWRGWYWVHLWSLSAQMQFYLVWPLLMLAAGRKRIGHLAVAAIVLVPVVRVLTYLLLPIWYTQGHSLETVLDLFATGSLLAVLRRRMGESAAYMHFVQSSGVVGLVLLVCVLQVLAGHFFKVNLLVATPLNLSLAILIDRCIRFPEGGWGRLLASRPLVALGTISYSLYVWQQPFINEGTVLSFPASLGLALVAGTVVYYAVEKPFTALGRRYR